jgi:CBS domain-containing protein
MMPHHRPMHEVIIRRAPITLPPEATVQDACREMRQQRIGAVLITDQDGRLVGIFTGRDAICRMLAEARDPSATRLAEVMTPKPATMGPRQRAIEALRLMRDGGFRHVPVVEGERLLGIVSRGDFHGHEHSRLEEEGDLWERL